MRLRLWADRTPSRFFLVVWVLCYFIHHSRSWTSPGSAIAGLAAIICALSIKNLRWAWWAALLPQTLILAYDYPFLANHLVIILLVNVFLLTTAALNQVHRTDWMARTLLFFISVVYLWAGLHKLNWDFLNADVSCANQAVADQLGFFFAGAEPFAKSLTFLPYLVIVAQLSFEPLLMFSKTFLFGVTGALLFHFLLSPLGFVHFASIPLAIFFLNWIFRKNLPEHEKELWFKGARIYIAAQIAVGLAGALRFLIPIGPVIFWAQLVIWAAAAALFAGRLWRTRKMYGTGLDVTPPLGGAAAVPIAAALIGSSNYLGLGTSNSFSMFSNLRTEGSEWNHLFFPRAMRLFHYQDHIYYTDTIIEAYVGTVNDNPRPDYGLPSLEYYRLYDIWRTMVPLPKTFLIRSPYPDGDPLIPIYDVLPPDLKPYSYLEFKLLNFRPVQGPGPNRCRW